MAVVQVAVVGAGVTGLSIAWHLAGLGLEPLVLEKTGIGAEASGVQPGGVRQQWSTRINCELARESIGFYRELSDRLGTRATATFESCGYVFLAHGEARLEELRAGVAVQNAACVPSRLLTAVEAGELVPGLETGGLAGAATCPEDGYFDRPQAVVEAFAEAAQARGARIAYEDVRALERDGAGWRLDLGGRSLRAEQVVVAAGYDSPALLARVGVRLPIEREARHLFYSEPIAERLLEPLVISAERRFAAKQLADGRVLASDLGACGDPTEGREVWRSNVRMAIDELLPALAYVSFPLLVSGTYDVTPDHQPLLGRVGGADGLWLAAGFSGHGFMLAPAVGRRIAAAVAGGTPDRALEELSLARFDTGHFEPELQTV